MEMPVGHLENHLWFEFKNHYKQDCIHRHAFFCFYFSFLLFLFQFQQHTSQFLQDLNLEGLISPHDSKCVVSAI